MKLEERVILAQNDDNLRNLLISEYRNFFISCAKKTVCRFIKAGSDEISVAMIAFDEAITKYDSSKGSFLNFAYIIIRNRLIDYMRKEYKDNMPVPFSSLSKTGSEGEEVAFDVEDLSFDIEARLEIQALSEELKAYGISFFDLPKQTPKYKKTKRDCFFAINSIVKTPLLVKEIKEKKYLPIKAILASSIEVAVEKASENDVELSRDLDVSLGRARAIKEYTQEFGGDIKENANNLSNMSVGEIRRELAKNRKERLKETGQNQDNANQNTRHSLKAGSEKDKQKADKKDREKLDRQILRDTRDNTTKNSQRDNEREANEANQKKTPNTKSERDRKNPNDNKNNKDKNKNPDFGRKS